jgi:uncharacterized protein (DUF4415 family)
MKKPKSKSNRPKPPAGFDDNPAWSSADLRRARPASVIVPAIVAEQKRRAGRPRLENAKVPVSLRLDPDVLAAYKKTGQGWQRRINATLAKGAAKLRAKG